MARGRIIHARFLQQREKDPDHVEQDPRELMLFDHATQLCQSLGDVRGEAESFFWAGCFYQIVRRDNGAAIPLLDRSFELASQTGDKLTMSEALRHLGIAAHAAGQLDTARRRLKDSTRLRREIGLLPGVAANLIGLAYIAAAQGRRDDALQLFEEAGAIAETSGAQRIARPVSEARGAIYATNQGRHQESGRGRARACYWAAWQD